MSLQTVNPATGQVIKTYEEMTEKEAFQIIDQTQQAFLKWRNVAIAERAKILHKVADLLKRNKNKYAEIITSEMGKPITPAVAEIEKCAWVCQHYAENAANYLEPRVITTEMQKSYVSYEPLGIIFAIMPWNFPFWQVFRFAAPTLMAGNAALLKHAPISTGAALMIEQLLHEAGLPENLFRTLVLSNEVAEKVIANRLVKAVTITGSGRAGSIVGKTSAKHLKRVVLELGGSDPYLILADADLEEAAETCVKSRMNNSGQVCISAKRLIPVTEVRDEFEGLIKEKIKAYKMGDPQDSQTNMGPMARKDLRDEVHHQVLESVKKGAKLVMGGEIPDKDGFYYPPTLLTNVKPGMPAYDEEIFGPVICIVDTKDEADAIRIANDTPFGLAAAVFTRDLDRGEKIARHQIEAGSVAVNTFVASDPRLPFGGIKQSGYGRELSKEGIVSFTNVKTVSIK
ncbi:MAG: NAD-dependent succinate-semialdehyde dehydrogenase [Pseudomonadota bacterium]